MARIISELAFLVATDQATYFDSDLLKFLKNEGFKLVGKELSMDLYRFK